MKFNQGASIYTEDGKEVGRIDRVVINPKTKEISDIVVRKGFLFKHDKVVPTSAIANGDDDRITLRMQDGELDSLPDFEETHYVPVSEAEIGRREGYAPASYPQGAYSTTGVNPGIEPAYISRVERNIPEDTVALKEGAKVFANDGKHVGTVTEVLTDSQREHVTHFLIAKGLVQKEVRLIPVAWIETLTDSEVHLTVDERTVEEVCVFEHA